MQAYEKENMKQEQTHFQAQVLQAFHVMKASQRFPLHLKYHKPLALYSTATHEFQSARLIFQGIRSLNPVEPIVINLVTKPK